MPPSALTPTTPGTPVRASALGGLSSRERLLRTMLARSTRALLAEQLQHEALRSRLSDIENRQRGKRSGGGSDDSSEGSSVRTLSARTASPPLDEDAWLEGGGPPAPAAAEVGGEGVGVGFGGGNESARFVGSVRSSARAEEARRELTRLKQLMDGGGAMTAGALSMPRSGGGGQRGGGEGCQLDTESEGGLSSEVQSITARGSTTSV